MWRLILRHAWLNLWDKHMTTGRINQVLSQEQTAKSLSTLSHQTMFSAADAYTSDAGRPVAFAFSSTNSAWHLSSERLFVNLLVAEAHKFPSTSRPSATDLAIWKHKASEATLPLRNKYKLQPFLWCQSTKPTWDTFPIASSLCWAGCLTPTRIQTDD